METKVQEEVKAETRDIQRYENNYGYVVPRCDIRETNDQFILLMEMPGTKKDSLSVKLDKGHLVVEGRMVNGHDGSLVYSEIPKRNYRRVFKLTEMVNPDAIQARWLEGMLELTLAKKEEVKPRDIEINIQ